MDVSDFKNQDNISNMKSLIKKIIDIQKPNGVYDVEVSVDPISDKEYYVSLVFLVSDDSEFLETYTEGIFYNDSKLNEVKRNIVKTIENYLSIKVYINQFGVRVLNI